jgi:flagellar biosynthesis/type III secretory pathway chaperone
MMDTLNDLIHALREELEQYGEMLARLDEQQEYAMRRAADELLMSVSAVQQQGERVRKARQARAQAQACLAEAMSLPGEATFAQITLLLPENYRPLLQALVQENNELLVRVQQRARQNHVLLLRSLELMRNLMNSLFPGSAPPVYNETGVVLNSVIPKRSFYEAAG